MGRPPTKPPDTWGLILCLKTSTKSLQKVFKHQLSCQQSTWLVEFALSPPPLINPTPANRHSPVVSTQHFNICPHLCVWCCPAPAATPAESCSNLCGDQGTGVGLRQPEPLPSSPTWPLAALQLPRGQHEGRQILKHS